MHRTGSLVSASPGVIARTVIARADPVGVGCRALLSALQANRSTRGIPVLLVDRRAGGMTSGLGPIVIRSGRLPRRSGHG